LFERYYQELLSFISGRLGDRERARDVVQETYARVLGMQMATPDSPLCGPAVLHPRALLYRTAKNLVIDDQRRAVTRPASSATDLDADETMAPESDRPDARLDARQSAQLLIDAIQGLTPRCQEAFVLFKIEGLPQSEIAERMGISRNMVEKHVIAGMLACRRSQQAPPPRAR
jgi:RNA polymerase sigma factor (sigma-70 family)